MLHKNTQIWQNIRQRCYSIHYQKRCKELVIKKQQILETMKSEVKQTACKLSGLLFTTATGVAMGKISVKNR